MQLPLIHCVESEDVYLDRQPEVLWFGVLRNLDWQLFVSVAAQYYEALWRFNLEQAQNRAAKARKAQVANPETKEEATIRLLFERATLCEDAPLLEETPDELEVVHVDPSRLGPGRTPVRLAGRTPKCFFAMFAAFVGIALKGRAPEPEEVYEELRDNPSFARACGFTLHDPLVGYRWSDVPSLRKLQQYDQILTNHGLWDQAAVKQVVENLNTGVVKVNSTLVHDTTHYQAYSAFRTVELPEEEDQQNEAESSADSGTKEASVTKKGKKNRKAKRRSRAKKKRRKSQARTTKNCRCEDRTNCPHEWVSADSGAGTVVKAGGKKHWAHKASTFAFAGQEGVLLSAAAMTDAPSHDSKSIEPHLERLFARHPELEGLIKRLLDDKAADDAGLKARLKQKGIELLAAINPRGRKPITKELPRGIDHLTAHGTPVCRAEFPFDFLGCRHEEERFLFRAPDLPFQKGKPVCEGCPFKAECCREDAERRHVSIPFDRLPWIDPEFPQLSLRFQTEMAKRTLIERLHKLMKYDFGDERLTKRGSKEFQARLDKTKLAMHLALAHDST